MMMILFSNYIFFMHFLDNYRNSKLLDFTRPLRGRACLGLLLRKSAKQGCLRYSERNFFDFVVWCAISALPTSLVQIKDNIKTKQHQHHNNSSTKTILKISMHCISHFYAHTLSHHQNFEFHSSPLLKIHQVIKLRLSN